MRRGGLQGSGRCRRRRRRRRFQQARRDSAAAPSPRRPDAPPTTSTRLSSRPGDGDYAFNLGYAYWLEKDSPAAIYWLREAVRRDPGDSDAHFVLSAALQQTGAARRRLASASWPAAVARMQGRALSRADTVPGPRSAAPVHRSARRARTDSRSWRRTAASASSSRSISTRPTTFEREAESGSP